METETLNEIPEEQLVVESKAPKPKRNTRALVIAAAAVVLLAYFGIAPRLRQSHTLAQAQTLQANQVPLVSVAAIRPAGGTADITLPSNIQAIETTNIQSQTSGYMKQRFVDIGSQVKQGQLLAIIASPEVDQQLNANVADVAQARADVGKAQADSANLKAAIVASRSEESGKEAALMQAKANLAHLKAKDIEAHSAVNVARSMESEAEHKLAGARADLLRNQAQVTIAQKTLARWQQLAKGDAVSGQDVDEKTANYQESQAQVQASEAAISSAQADVSGAQGSIASAQASAQAADADVLAGVQNVSAAQSAVASSKANVQAAIATYQASLSNVGASMASLNSQQSNFGRVRAEQSFERITAPFSGVITARNVDVGDLVAASSGGSGASDPMNTVTKTGLFGLARTDVLRVQVNVPEDYISSIRNGQPAEITVDEYPGRIFTGHVFNVSGALDAASRTLLVEVRVPNANDALKPGMYARVHFLRVHGTAPLQIPANALVFDANGTRVVKLMPDKTVRFVDVSLGRDLGDSIEVLQGVKAGDTLVTNPSDSLQEGQKVKVAGSEE